MAVTIRLPPPLVELIDSVLANRPPDSRPEDIAREDYVLGVLIEAAQAEAALLGYAPTITVEDRRIRK